MLIRKFNQNIRVQLNENTQNDDSQCDSSVSENEEDVESEQEQQPQRFQSVQYQRITWNQSMTRFPELNFLSKQFVSQKLPLYRIRCALMSMINFIIHHKHLTTVKQLYDYSSLMNEYQQYAVAFAYYNHWIDDANSRKLSPTTISNHIDMVIQLFKLFTLESYDPVIHKQHHSSFDASACLARLNLIIEDLKKKRRNLYTDANKFKAYYRTQRNLTQLNRWIDEKQLGQLNTTAIDRLEEMIAMIKQDQSDPDIELDMAESYQQALLVHLCLSLGVPRTNFGLTQWNLGTTLTLEDSNYRLITYRNDFNLKSGTWIFRPGSIKSASQVHRSIHERIVIPNALNKYIRYFLTVIRPVLLKGRNPFTHKYFFVSMTGTALSGSARLSSFKSFCQDVIGIAINFQDLRRCVGTALFRNSVLTPEEKRSAIHLMDHSELTHQMYYNVPEGRSEEDERTNVHPFFHFS